MVNRRTAVSYRRLQALNCGRGSLFSRCMCPSSGRASPGPGGRREGRRVDSHHSRDNASTLAVSVSALGSGIANLITPVIAVPAHAVRRSLRFKQILQDTNNRFTEPDLVRKREKHSLLPTSVKVVYIMYPCTIKYPPQLLISGTGNMVWSLTL